MKKAIIIGAGPAGLTAAYYFLTKTEIKPIIVEKEKFVGGISRTVEFEGNRMDIGGHRFFSKNEEIVQLWEKLLPLQGAASFDDKKLNRDIPLTPDGPDPGKSDRVLLVRNRISRILYLRKFFDYPIALKLQTILNMGIGNTFRVGLGYIWAACHKCEEKNLEDFMINRFGKPLYRMFFRDYTEKVWGRSPKDIDADWGKQRIKGLSLSKALLDVFKKLFGRKDNAHTETSLIESFYYPKFGPGQLWETMREEVERLGGEILLEHRVEKFSFAGDTIVGVTVLNRGEEKTIKGDYVFSSMPIVDLIAAMGNHVIDEMVKKTAKELPYRDFITVGLLVDKLKIKNTTKLKTLADIVPDCWIYVQEHDVKLGRIQIFNNWSPYMVEDPEHTVWVGLEYFCNEGDAMWNMDEQAFIALATEEMVKIGLIVQEDVRKSVRIKVEKAYPAYFGSYKDFAAVQKYLDSVDNLYCIGRNGQHRYNNMDHSMLSAMTAVDIVAFGTASKQDLWNVNAEQEYHEKVEARGNEH